MHSSGLAIIPYDSSPAVRIERINTKICDGDSGTDGACKSDERHTCVDYKLPKPNIADVKLINIDAYTDTSKAYAHTAGDFRNVDCENILIASPRVRVVTQRNSNRSNCSALYFRRNGGGSRGPQCLVGS